MSRFFNIALARFLKSLQLCDMSIVLIVKCVVIVFIARLRLSLYFKLQYYTVYSQFKIILP